MKKLIAALAICVGTAAFAHETQDKAQKARQEQTEKKRDATQVFTQKPGDSIKESKRDAEEGWDATEVGPKIGTAAKDAVGIQTESEGTFKVAQAFSMKGTLKDATLEGVSIARPGLPVADLDVREKTAVWLDGKKVKGVDAIPEGTPVRVKFQVEGQDLVAVELRATSVGKTKAKSTPAAKPMDNRNDTGGSGTLNDDAQEMKHDVKSGANEMKHDVKDSANEAESDINKSLK